MKTYEETTRSIMERAETQIQKNKKRNRVIRTAAAFTCFAVFAVTAVFGVKAMMRPGTVTNDKSEGLTETANVSNDASIKTLSAFVADGGDGLFATGVSFHEYPVWSLENLAYHVDDNAPKTAEIDVLGVHYTGNYTFSAVLINADTFSTVLSHAYNGVSENGRNALFWIDSETGRLMQLLTGKELSDDVCVDEDKCRVAAERIANSFIGEKADKYCVETRTDGTYYFTYYAYRMIDGYKSADRIIVTVDRDGELAQLIISSLGSLDGIDVLPFSPKAAEAIVDQKINVIAPSILGYKNHEIKNAVPVLLDDGTVGIVYRVIVNAEFPAYDEETGELETASSAEYLTILVKEQ